MIDEKTKQMTFAILDQLKGIAQPAPTKEEEFPLPAWYRAIREVPLSEFSVEDISKACRQRIHLEQMVPLALQLLESEPLAGQMYDGELLVSLKSVPSDYWSEHEADRRSLKSAFEAALQEQDITDDVRQKAEEFLRKMITTPRN